MVQKPFLINDEKFVVDQQTMPQSVKQLAAFGWAE